MSHPSKLKVLHVINMLKPGGAELVSLNILKELNRNGNAETFLFAARVNDNLVDKQLFEKQIDKDNIFESHFSEYRNIKKLRCLLNDLMDTIKLIQPNVIHSHCELPDFVLFILKSKLKNSVIIRTSHNERFSRKARLGLLIENLMAKRFDSNVCISEKIYSQHRSSNKVLIYNALRIGNAYEARKPVIDKAIIRVGIIGRLCEQKNQMELLDVVSTLDGLLQNKMSFHFFGTGEDEVLLKEMASQVRTKVVFHGFEHNIDNIYRQIDVVIIPSKFEGLSSVMIEALSRRVPVFSTSVSGVCDIERLIGRKLSFDTIEEMLNHMLTNKIKQVSEAERNELLNLFSQLY